METIAGISLLAVIIEGTVKYLLGEAPDGFTRPYIQYITLGLGVVLSVLYQVDILAMIGLVSPIPYVGYVVSGLIIGRGSNYLNDIIGNFRK